MATMTAAQKTAELTRKAKLGIKPTDSKNTAAYNKIKASTSTSTAKTSTSAAKTSTPSTSSKTTAAKATTAAKNTTTKASTTTTKTSAPATTAKATTTKSNVSKTPTTVSKTTTPTVTTPKVTAPTALTTKTTTPNYTVPYSKAITTVDQAKQIYDQAKAAGASQEALNAIHNRADEIRGYKTDPSGINKLSSGNSSNALYGGKQGNSNPNDLQSAYNTGVLGQETPDYTADMTSPYIPQNPAYQTIPEEQGQGQNLSYQVASNNNSYADTITKWKEEALASQLPQIESAYAQSKADINNQLPLVSQQANELSNQNDVLNAQELQKLMAAAEASGVYRGGDNLLGQTQLSAARVNNLNDIEMNKDNQILKLRNQLALLDQQQANAETQARAGIDSTALDKLIQADQQATQDAISAAQLTGSYNGQQTLAAQNQNFNQGVTMAGLTGYYNPYSNVAISPEVYQYANDYQGEINRRMAINPSDPMITQLKAARAAKIFSDPESLKQYGDEFKTIDYRNADRAFDYQTQRDAVADQQWQKQLDLDMRRQSFNEAQAKIDNAFNQQQINISQRNQALDWAKFNADQDPNSIDNLLKKQQIDVNSQAKQDSMLNNIIQRLDGIYLVKDSLGSVSRNVNFTDAQVRAAILGLKLSDDQTDALLLRYGLPINQ